MSNNIDEAIKFVLDSVDLPAIASPYLSKEIKRKVQFSGNRVRTFRKTGDLYDYLSRFKLGAKEPNRAVYESLKKLGLKTYEELLPEFESRFRHSLGNVTTLDDFFVGGTYSTADLTNFSKQYFDNVPGITPIKSKEGTVIFVKATIGGNFYSNEWIDFDKELKYYFFARSNKAKGRKIFSPEYKENKLILESYGIPIYVFVNQKIGFRLSGIYSLKSHHENDDGSRWFHLIKREDVDTDKLESFRNIEEKFLAELEISKKRDSNDRQARAGIGNKKPKKISAIVEVYQRNPDIVVETLLRAAGVCQECKQPAPFIREKDKTPYLEVHHRVQLANGGADSLENTIAVCPNCHRKLHFGIKV